MQRLGWTLCLLAVLVLLIAPVMFCGHSNDGIGGIATIQADISHSDGHDASTCVLCTWRLHRDAIQCVDCGMWRTDPPLESSLPPVTITRPASSSQHVAWARAPPTLS